MIKIIEDDIRPARLMEKQKIFALVDVGRMLSRYKDFVFVQCPACGGNSTFAKFIKNGIKYVECNNCETFYVNPRPSSEVLEWFYAESPNYAYWNDVIFPASESVRRDKIFVPRVDSLIELCSKYKVFTGSLLEVGAGFGTFCSEVNIRNVFDRIVAVEPTPNLAKTCREKGLEVIEKPIEKIKFKNNDLFDVVANFEVIEHLFSPANFVRSMNKLLKVGGLLVLTCPNGKGFDIEVLGVASDTVDHEHLNYFNSGSLSTMLENNGFEVVESFTPGVLDASLVRNKILSGEFKIDNQSFFNKILINKWNELGSNFQEFLIQNELSSNLWIVAKKVSI